MQNGAPLYDAVEKAARTAKARFCMPGHSGSGKGVLFASCALDYTEVPGLDNLACPEGVILEAERLAAAAQGCARTLFVTGGSTTCMHVALSLAKERGNVGCVGKMHKSFYNGCAILGISPVCFADVDDFLSKPLKTQNVSTVFYTSPDYFGNVVDDGKLLEECSENEILTVADAAHGAHFAYSSLLPQAAAGRADVSFCSMHKTMSVYTGGALINLKDDSLYDKAVYYRQLWHTTSPSYLVMASMDHAREVYARRGEEIYGGILAARREFEREAVGKWFSVVKSDDVSRLVISCGGLDAQQANVALAQKGVYAEAAIGDSLIFILSESNVSCLRLLLRTLAECRPPAKAPEIYAPERKRAQATGAVTFVPVSEGAGRVCMNEVGFYPPGTPFVGRGEILTAGDVETIAKNRGCTFGLVNGKLVVLQ